MDILLLGINQEQRTNQGDNEYLAAQTSSYCGTLSLPIAKVASKIRIVYSHTRSDHDTSLYRLSTPGAKTISLEESTSQTPGPYLSVVRRKACLSPHSSTDMPTHSITIATSARMDVNVILHTNPDDSGAVSRAKMSVLTSPGQECKKAIRLFSSAKCSNARVVMVVV